MTDLQLLVEALCKAWEAGGQWVAPNLTDCLDFIVSEAGEAVDARLRTAAYVRNNPDEAGQADIAEEVSDTLLMCLVTLNVMGLRAEDLLLHKLRRMDKKRGDLGHHLLYE